MQNLRALNKTVTIMISGLLFSGLLLSNMGCKDKAKLDSDNQKISYLMGMNIVQGAKRSGMEIDSAAFMAGVEDTLNDKPSRLTDEQMREAMQAYQKEAMSKREEQLKAQAASNPEMAKAMEENKKKGDAFLSENKAKKGVTTTASGLQYKILKDGKGDKPKAESTVKVHYTGKLISGKVFDSSVERKTPAEFPVNRVIAGWTEALQLMSPGAKWQLFIPSELAYGSSGRPPTIGPNEVLIFDVELLEIL